MKTMTRGKEREDTAKTLIIQAETQEENIKRDTILDLVSFPVEKRPLEIRGTKISVPTHYALYRKDQELPITVVSAAYQLVPHRTVLEPILGRMEHGRWTFRKCRVENFGARVWIEAVNMGMAYKMGSLEGKIDSLHPRLLLCNSYDGSLALRFAFGIYRLLCTNGMTAPAEGFKDMNLEFHHKHIGESVDRFVKELDDQVKKFYESFETIAKTYRGLVNMKVSQPLAEKIIRETVGVKRINRILDIFKSDKTTTQDPTGWNLYNAISNFLSHDFNGGMMVREEKLRKAMELLQKAN